MLDSDQLIASMYAAFKFIYKEKLLTAQDYFKNDYAENWDEIQNKYKSETHNVEDVKSYPFWRLW